VWSVHAAAIAVVVGLLSPRLDLPGLGPAFAVSPELAKVLVGTTLFMGLVSAGLYAENSTPEKASATFRRIRLAGMTASSAAAVVLFLLRQANG
jgi:hypothetical protein